MADKAELQKLLLMPEMKLADAERCIEKFEQNKDSPDKLSTKDDETETKLRISEKHVPFFEDVVSKESSQLLEKNCSSSDYRERIAVIKQ